MAVNLTAILRFSYPLLLFLASTLAKGLAMAGILNRLADLTASFIVSRSHFGKVAGKPDFGLSEGIQLYFHSKIDYTLWKTPRWTYLRCKVEERRGGWDERREGSSGDRPLDPGQGWKFMSCSHCQELLAPDWLHKSSQGTFATFL